MGKIKHGIEKHFAQPSKNNEAILDNGRQVRDKVCPLGHTEQKGCKVAKFAGLQKFAYLPFMVVNKSSVEVL